MHSNLTHVTDLIQNADRIAILSGAGVSTASGITDFRSEDGLYNQKVFGLSPEKILSTYFFNTYRDLFYKYYLSHMVIPDDIQPNTIHYKTTQLNTNGKLVGVITQNIDGLYQKAGLPSDRLVEIHGNGNRWICVKCKQSVAFDKILYNSKTGNYFSPCHNFLVRPDIVLYDEAFKKEHIEALLHIYENADLLIVMGTSLDIVFHLESVKNFHGQIVLINHTYVDIGQRPWDAIYLGDIKSAFN